MIRRSLPANTNILTCFVRSCNCRGQHLFHSRITLVEQVCDQAGVAIEPQCQLSQIVGTDRETINTVKKAQDVVMSLNTLAEQNNEKPLVFATLVNDDVRKIISDGDVVFFDLFDTFIGPLEKSSVSNRHIR